MTETTVSWDLIPRDAKLVVVAWFFSVEVYITIHRGDGLTLPSKYDWMHRKLPNASRLRFKVLHKRVGNHFEYVYLTYFENWFDLNGLDGTRSRILVEKNIDGKHRGLDYRSFLIMNGHEWDQDLETFF